MVHHRPFKSASRVLAEGSWGTDARTESESDRSWPRTSAAVQRSHQIGGPLTRALRWRVSITSPSGVECTRRIGLLVFTPPM